MRKYLIALALVLGVMVGWYTVSAQTNPFYIVQNSQGVHITAGTLFPSAATLGQNPADGQLHIQLIAGATANPVLWLYSVDATAWVPVSPIGTGVGDVPSTLVTNAVDVAGSVWGGTNELIFEGTTANAFENEFRSADATVGVATFLLPDQAAAADIYPLMWSLFATNSLETANSIWFDTNMIEWEGATADAFETRLIAEDADTGIHTFQLPDQNAAADIYALMWSLLDTNALQVANSVWFNASALVAEGLTADDFETTINFPDVGQDMALTIDDYGVAAASLLPVLAATNIPEAANSIWVDPARGVVYEGAGVDAFEIEVIGQDSTVGVDTYAFMDRGLAADTYEVVGVPDVVWTTGNLYWGEYTDAAAAFGNADDVMVVQRIYIPHTTTVIEVDILSNPLANASAADNTIAVAIYYDADAGAQIVEVVGATDDTAGAATQLENLNIADTTLNPGWYRIAFCAQDATDHDIEGHTAHADYLLMAGGGAAAGELYSEATNPCVNGDPPATTGALVQAAHVPVFKLRTQ